MCALMESSRIAAGGWYLRTALYSSLDSLMSQYHREVWEQYHLFLLEFEDKEGLEEELTPYLNTYLERQSLSHLYKKSLSVPKAVRITDENGIWLEQEILDYMKMGNWNPDDAGNLSELEKGFKEAEGIGDITENYQKNTQKVLALERTLEALEESVKNQEEYWKKGQQKLNRRDGSGFIKTAKQMKKELKKMPMLVSDYEEKAKELSEALTKSEQEAQKKKEKLTEKSWDLISAELKHYRSYSEKEGERYQEIFKLQKQADRNLVITNDAIEEAEKVLEYISDWEAEDEEDELDEERLWNGVLRIWNRIETGRFINLSSIKDKRSMKKLEKLSQLIGKDLLDLVIPEGRTVSDDWVDPVDFPSSIVLKKESATGRSQGKGVIKGIIDRVLINEYLGNHFTCFLSEEEKSFPYEQEYILAGRDFARQNLKETVNRLIKIRSSANFLYLLGDVEKRHQAEELAAAITGVASMSLLMPITVSFILMVWAFGEALMDMRILLDQGKVSFIKKSEDWVLSLEELLDFKRHNRKIDRIKDEEKDGMNYQQYLKALFMIQNESIRDYRMMDMIQKNITKQQENFLMTQGLVQMHVECEVKGAMIPIRRRAVRTY